MLSSEFSSEMGTLIRSLEQRVMLEADLRRPEHTGELALPLEHIERAIVSLVALHVHMRRQGDGS